VEEQNNIPGDEQNSDTYRNGVPKGYFESFNERLFAKLELEEELKEFPQLSGLAKKLPFSVPENYFGSLEQQVKERIGSEASVVSIGSFLNKYKYAIAAVFVLTIGTSLFFRYYNQSEQMKTDPACMELACLTKEEITNSADFNQMSLNDLESLAGQDIQDSLKEEINKDVVDELMQHPEDIGITEDDFEL
jgi:hypothetical protein